MSAPAGIAFDFDGTLADTAARSADILRRLAPELGLRVPADFAALRSLPTRELMRTLGVRFWQVPRLVRRFRDEAAVGASGVALFPGVAEMLGELAGAGRELAVVSSNRADTIRATLGANGVEAHFARVVGSRKLGGKARALRRLARRSPGGLVYVGDELRDIAAARRAGVGAVAVAWGYHSAELLATARPDFLARSPAEFASWLVKVG